MEIIKWIKNKIHVHYFNKQVTSKYVSFHTRQIIFECRCGNRISVRESKSFGNPFSKDTDLLVTEKEFNKLLNKR
jgi:hypothetical protein